MATLLHPLRNAGYAFAALFGYVIHHLLQPPIIYLSSMLSRTRIGRETFILASRLSVGLRPMLFALWLAFIGIVIVSLPSPPPAQASWWVLLATLLVLIVFNYSGRVLTVSNRGGGNWNIHLNVLRSRNQTSAVQWEGAFADLDAIVSMAREGGLKVLTLESTLLVHDVTAKRMTRKLERTFSKHGLVADVKIEEPRALGVMSTGLLHVVLARQRHLKAHRVVRSAPLNMMTRQIEIKFSRAPRSSFITEIAG